MSAVMAPISPCPSRSSSRPGRREPVRRPAHDRHVHTLGEQGPGQGKAHAGAPTDDHCVSHGPRLHRRTCRREGRAVPGCGPATQERRPAVADSEVVNAMAGFLRIRRGRIGPADVGLPTGPGARRTPGLRREELAALAGVSVDYYIRIEQGRETAPSDAVLGALARALRLSADEHAHLLGLADRVAGRTPRRRPAQARPASRWPAAAAGVGPAQPGLCARRSQRRAGRQPGGPCLDAWARRSGRPDSATRSGTPSCITAARTLFADWDRVTRNCVAALHAAELTAPDRAAALADELSSASGEFAASVAPA